MRILLGTDTYPPTVNGAARFTERYAHALAARGHEVHVLCPSPSGPSAVVDHAGVTVHEVASFGYPLYESFRISLPWSAASRTEQVVREICPDIVHVQDNFLIGRGLAAACRRHSVGLVATNHLMPANFFDHVPVPAALRAFGAARLWADVAKVFRDAQVVTSPTPRAVELLVEATGFTHAVAVSNGIDQAPYQAAAAACRQRPGLHGEIPTVLFVGRLDQEKRVGELLRAFALLPSTTAARLEIVGTGSLRAKLEQQATALGLDQTRVAFRGFVTDDELLQAYGRADVFCMPGVAELQSLVTLEAMAAGKPVVAADAMALPHLCRPGLNGYLFAPGDIEELAGHLNTLLTNPDLRARMGQASSRIVAQHGFAQTIATFERLYDEVRAPVSLDRAA